MRRWQHVLRPALVLTVVGGVLGWWGIPTRHYAYWVMARPFQSHVGSVILVGLFGFLLGLLVEFINDRIRNVEGGGTPSYDANYGWIVGVCTAVVFVFALYEAHASDQLLNKYNAGVMNGLGSLTTAANRLEQANVTQGERYTSAGEYLELGAGNLMADDSALSSLHIPHTTSIAFSMQYAGDVLLNPQRYPQAKVNETVRYVKASSKAFSEHRLFGDFLQHPQTLKSIFNDIYAVMPESDKQIWP